MISSRPDDHIEIPKIIHFIWVGDSPMPEENRQVLLDWKQKNPGLEVWLWVDEAGCLSKEHWEFIKNTYDYLVSDHSIKLKDITYENVVTPPSRYEINRLRPNYGAASDLLRYNILYKFGGAYFDSDVKCGSGNLAESHYFQTENEHKLYLDHNSQNSGSIGSDAIICSRGNPLMKRIAEGASNNYSADHLSQLEEITADLYPHIMAYQYEQFAYITRTTPDKTGPGRIREVVRSENGSDIPGVYSMDDVRDMSSTNECAWINQKLREFITLEMALQTIFDGITFESTNMKILRIDDHISNLIELFNMNEDAACKHVIEIIKNANLDLSNLNCFQLTYRYPPTVQYCSDHGLFNKTFLYPHNCAIIKLKDTDFFSIPIMNVIGEGIFNGLTTEHRTKIIKRLPEKKLAELANQMCKSATFFLQNLNQHLMNSYDNINDLLSYLTYQENIFINLESRITLIKEFENKYNHKNEWSNKLLNTMITHLTNNYAGINLMNLIGSPILNCRLSSNESITDPNFLSRVNQTYDSCIALLNLLNSSINTNNCEKISIFCDTFTNKKYDLCKLLKKCDNTNERTTILSTLSNELRDKARSLIGRKKMIASSKKHGRNTEEATQSTSIQNQLNQFRSNRQIVNEENRPLLDDSKKNDDGGCSSTCNIM